MLQCFVVVFHAIFFYTLGKTLGLALSWLSIFQLRSCKKWIAIVSFEALGQGMNCIILPILSASVFLLRGQVCMIELWSFSLFIYLISKEINNPFWSTLEPRSVGWRDMLELRLHVRGIIGILVKEMFQTTQTRLPLLPLQECRVRF